MVTIHKLGKYISTEVQGGC